MYEALLDNVKAELQEQGIEPKAIAIFYLWEGDEDDPFTYTGSHHDGRLDARQCERFFNSMDATARRLAAESGLKLKDHQEAPRA